MKGTMARLWRRVFALTLLSVLPALAQTGPFNAEFPAGGDGLARSFGEGDLPAGGAWSLYGWVNPGEIAPGRVIIAGVGEGAEGRYLALEDGKLAAWTPYGDIAGSCALKAGTWQFLAVTDDGKAARLTVDGQACGEGALAAPAVKQTIQLAPRGIAGTTPFAGRLAHLMFDDRALKADEIAALAKDRPDFSLIVFDSGSPPWPVQTHQMFGQVTPQDPWTLPKGKAPFSQPVAKPAYDGPALRADGHDAWTLAQWHLIAAPKIAADGAVLSKPGYDAKAWYQATVPGTVLQTLIDRGVYPDPDYGLNNMAIPESLHDQDYWYRSEFTAPADLRGRHLLLTFNGINYAAEIWLNGKRIGATKGAFIRGAFDVTGALIAGRENAIAVKVSPPPHPGIAEEESLAAGVGENGGMEALDGPTFMASEGWDWIPSVRDRDTGLWQDVTLKASGPLRLGDPQIVTTLPKPDNSLCDVEIDVAIDNLAPRPIRATVTAGFDDVQVARTLILKPGKSVVKFLPAQYPQLAVQHPQLWWPNGYGAPALHVAQLRVFAGHALSDEKQVRFGMRQITYHLSAMDETGHLDRVALDFSKARARGQQILDVRHRTIRKIPDGWVYSLMPGASPAVTPANDAQLTPYLVIEVNGVKIAARGGSWGTDDWLKRISRGRLEPYFRLHRDAHLNIIRNWVGQNTEPVFYDLADEYGLLVLNDFWESTQDYQLEAEDVPLFLANAADVVARYRNHPSIVLWFGRNEGVPQPVLNQGLDETIRKLDGTRMYMPSSNRIDLANSGPYNYRDPAGYFTQYDKGFAVEVGSTSFPTLEAFEAAVPEPDRWPVSDSWAYHDWHANGNGATKAFTDAMDAKFGAPASLADFARKAQMMNYETFRAIFEGMNAGLWKENSGRLLWMTEPAWPSTAWQIFSHDGDTHAAYYGVKEACEAVHAQMNLPDHRLAVVNNTLVPIAGAILHAALYALDGTKLGAQDETLALPANAVTNGRMLDLAPLLAEHGVVFVALRLDDADGKLLSRNFYWVAKDDAAERALAAMPQERVTVSLAGGGGKLTVTLHNEGSALALETKLTLEDQTGARILPAYYSDNYVSLLPGETRRIEIDYPAVKGAPKVALRGFNVVPARAQLP